MYNMSLNNDGDNVENNLPITYAREKERLRARAIIVHLYYLRYMYIVN